MQGDFPIVRPGEIADQAERYPEGYDSCNSPFARDIVSRAYAAYRFPRTFRSAFQGCVCKDLHFLHPWRNLKQFTGPGRQRLRDLASQVGIAARFIGKGVEDAELPRPDLDRIPFQGPFFIQREWLS